jgi:hypothetical protein
MFRLCTMKFPLVATVLAVSLFTAMPALAVSLDKEKAAAELVEYTFSEDRISQGMVSVAGAMMEALYKQPELAKRRAELEPVLREVITAYASDPDLHALLKRIAIRAYSNNFTIGELNETLEFYRTATGKKWLKVSPTVIQEAYSDPEYVATLKKGLPEKYQKMLIEKLTAVLGPDEQTEETE